jgi:histone acetyltransferase (RNA polymerase elongator complex component)
MTARNSIIPVFVPHLGCPNDCVFCNQRRISGHIEPATAQTVKNAIEEAAALTPWGTKRQLAFYGGSFTAIPETRQVELFEAAQPYIEDGTISSIRLSTRPDAIDASVLKRLKKYGVVVVELGAQSMCDRVLELSGRGHDSAAVENASRLIKAAGFDLVLQMMTGLPGDTDESCIDTAKKIIALEPNGVRIYPTVIVRDTVLCDMWHAGTYKEHTVEDAVRICAKIVPLFNAAGIPIIRMGLNPTEDLSGGDALGGAYHPALGELVLSRIMLEKARTLLVGTKPGRRVVLGVNRSDVSKMVGQHRCNVKALTSEFSLSELKIHEASVKSGEISIVSLDKG